MIPENYFYNRDPAFLRSEQYVTLSQPKLDYGLLAKLLFVTMDILCGRRATISKFKVLEMVARVPYQAWEHVAYIAVTHMYGKPGFARRIFEFVKESRQQQDNEQWHLLILEDIVRKRGIKESVLIHRILPQFIAFFYYHVSWLLYVIKPRWSYQLNAEFEDHAEHEYMQFVKDHPKIELEQFENVFQEEYGFFDNIADLFRRIGLDERLHKEESLARVAYPRFV